MYKYIAAAVVTITLQLPAHAETAESFKPSWVQDTVSSGTATPSHFDIRPISIDAPRLQRLIDFLRSLRDD